MQDTYPLEDYIINANIQHQSGIAAASLFWTTNLNEDYLEIEMTNTESNNWQGNIPGNIIAPNSVYYYIQATAVSGKSLARPLPAPQGYFNFNILKDNISDLPTNTEIPTIEMDVFPNPANAITCIPIRSEYLIKGRLSLQNVLGQEVALIHDGEFISGQKNYFIQANNFSQGLYFIVLESERKSLKEKLIIQ